MLGGYISDLEAGDAFQPVEYVLTAFMASEYAHGAEESWEGFQSARAPGGRQIRTPTMIHVDKMRILEIWGPVRLMTTVRIEWYDSAMLSAAKGALRAWCWPARGCSSCSRAYGCGSRASTAPERASCRSGWVCRSRS
jgi:hypothetical protein